MDWMVYFEGAHYGLTSMIQIVLFFRPQYVDYSYKS